MVKLNLSLTNRHLRTQIVLTHEIKKILEKAARLSNENLSEYIRKAILIRYLIETNEKKQLEEVADKVIGSVNLDKHPEWKTKKSLQKWLRDLRKEL